MHRRLLDAGELFSEMRMHVNPLFSGQSIHWIFTVQKIHQVNKTKKKSMYVTVRAGVHTESI